MSDYSAREFLFKPTTMALLTLTLLAVAYYFVPAFRKYVDEIIQNKTAKVVFAKYVASEIGQRMSDQMGISVKGSVHLPSRNEDLEEKLAVILVELMDEWSYLGLRLVQGETIVIKNVSLRMIEHPYQIWDLVMVEQKKRRETKTFLGQFRRFPVHEATAG